MQNIFIVALLVSIVVAFIIEILFGKSFCRSCLTKDRNLLLTIGITFLGLHFLIAFPGIVPLKVWTASNLVGMWILLYYREIIKKEIFFRNNFKLLRSQRRKILLLSSILCYIIIAFLFNSYIFHRFTYSTTELKLTATLNIFLLFVTEIINIVYFLTLLNFYYLTKVTIWGENLTKYEGWLIEETKDYYILKEKFSGKIITVKKDVINQIVITGKGI